MEIVVNEKEVLRYLGCGSAADGSVPSLIAELSGLFSANAVPRSVYGVWDCQIDSSAAAFGGITVKSKNLARHLTCCRSAVLLATTLGTEADILLRRLGVQDMEKALIAQAVCAAMIEAYCDSIESELSKKKELDGLHPTTRFSPGYGDFDIAHQKDILRLLNCERIGLTLTDGYMLIPSKSVTAVIGFSRERKQVLGKCSYCAVKECDAREAV